MRLTSLKPELLLNWKGHNTSFSSVRANPSDSFQIQPYLKKRDRFLIPWAAFSTPVPSCLTALGTSTSLKPERELYLGFSMLAASYLASLKPLKPLESL